MKKLLFIFFQICFFYNFALSQDIISFQDLENKQSDKSDLVKLIKKRIEIENKIKELERDKSETNDKHLVEEYLKLEKNKSEIEDAGPSTEKEEAFKLVGDLAIDPSNSSYAITPQLKANYQSPRDTTGSFFQYEVSLNIKSPIQAKDSIIVLKNILKAGADGSLNIGGKYGAVDKSKKFGGLIGGYGKLNWLYSKNFDSLSTKSFGYFNFTGLAAVMIFPIVLSLQYEYNISSESTSNFLSNELNKSSSLNLLIGANLSNYQFQIKYLIHSEVNSVNTGNNDDNFEIKFGVNYNPFK